MVAVSAFDGCVFWKLVPVGGHQGRHRHSSGGSRLLSWSLGSPGLNLWKRVLGLGEGIAESCTPVLSDPPLLSASVGRGRRQNPEHRRERGDRHWQKSKWLPPWVFYCWNLSTQRSSIIHWTRHPTSWTPRSTSHYGCFTGLPGWLSGKESPASAGDAGSTPGSGRSPRGGNDNLLQYSCLGNRMDRGAWWATIHSITKSWTGLSYWECMHTL